MKVGFGEGIGDRTNETPARKDRSQDRDPRDDYEGF